MAYAAVASLLQTADILLNHHQHSISPLFKTQIISIHHHAYFLRSFIEGGSSERVNNWEETMREVTNKAEDIIELLLSDSLLKSSVGSSISHELERGKYEVCYYGLDELKKVAEEIESIANRVKGGRRIITADGSDEELMEIVSLLVGGSSSSLEMIAICGSGGMGKSTLADEAYFHPSIMEHFDVRLWSGVTIEHNWVLVIRDLLCSMKAEYSRSDSEDELIQRLLQILGRRRFLIWVDDVLSKDVLERLSITLPDYGNGSRIIFTTRSFDLANFAHHIHEMRLLDEDETWNLLRNKIFKGDPCPFQLESIGKMIARSCGGHQLSVAVVSGILASDQTKAAWEDVAQDMKKIACEVDEIVYLSYIYLPHHLRPCLLYLGIFPEDRVIRVSTLIRLWIAEGFLDESGYQSLEETGEEYVKDLVQRSLVSVHMTKFDCRIKSIKVHDLIRGMCRRQAHTDNFNLDFHRFCSDEQPWKVSEIIKSCRRVSNMRYSDDFLKDLYGSTIRTLFFFSEYGGRLDLRCWMENVKLIRILNLLNVESYSMCSKVFELFHLRYFAFYYEFNIPEAISNLENLQTLIIHHSKIGGVFYKLPEGIWRMQQLRHLYIISFKFPNKKGPTSAQQNLQTLSEVIDFVCLRENLKMIPNVKRLALLYTKGLRYVAEDYELHNLVYLKKLEMLKIEILDWSFEKVHKMSCAFPPTLKKLNLCSLKLSWEDMKMVASLPNLEVLKLRKHACIGDTWETSEGGFSQLISLRIEESNLENWNTKSSHFPRLRWLVLVRCSSLLEVPYEMADIPTFIRIDLDATNHSLLRSAKRIQQDRHGLGHDALHIYAV